MYIIQDENEAIASIKIDDDVLPFIKKQLSCYITGYQFMPGYRAGVTDGKKHFYSIMGDTLIFPKGLANLLSNSMNNKGYKCNYNKISYDDVMPSEEEFKSFISGLNLPFEPRDYQFKAAFDSIYDYRGVKRLATNAGKSIIFYILTRYFLDKNMKVVILVPRIMLVEQMYSDFKDYGWDDIDDFVIKIGGDNKIKDFGSSITLSTWQSLMNRPDVFKDVDVLLVDECHGAASDSDNGNIYEKVIFKASQGARYRLGFTGTIPQDAVGKMSLLGSLGSVKTYVTTRELIDRGLATPVEIKFLFLEYSDEDKKLVERLKYQDEVKFFNNHEKRNLTICKVINKVTVDGNSIVLVDNVEYGEKLARIIASIRNIDDDIKEFKKASNPHKLFVINGSTPTKEREQIRKLMEVENGVILIGTTSILSTGVNIKNLHNLFLTSGGKSFIQINQSIGRLLRTHVSKQLVKIWDIVDDCSIPRRKSVKKNHRYKHFEERLPMYNEHDYDTTEKIIKL